jgi:hypothetical protein
MNKKYIPFTRDKYVTAWRQLAPDESFGGMSLSEFEEATEPAVAARDHIEVLKTQAAAALQQRELADGQLRQTLMLVINSVRGAPAHGENSPLYRAFGYVPKSERGSGLTRKASAADADAA